MIVCVCHNVSESELKSAIRSGMDNMHSLREHLAIGTCCGKCKSCAKKILRECQAQEENPHAQVHTLHFQALAA